MADYTEIPVKGVEGGFIITENGFTHPYVMKRDENGNLINTGITLEELEEQSRSENQ